MSHCGPGWPLTLQGSFGHGLPVQVRVQGRRVAGREGLAHDCIGWIGKEQG